jgi:hypothetical protein
VHGTFRSIILVFGRRRHGNFAGSRMNGRLADEELQKWARKIFYAPRLAG